MLNIQRVYDKSNGKRGSRFLVDRLWPRGFRKEEVKADAWLQDVAPSRALCKWFGHDPAKWAEFRKRYFAELDAAKEAWAPIVTAARHGEVTLLYSARDTEHNNAVALRDYLKRRVRPTKRRTVRARNSK